MFNVLLLFTDVEEDIMPIYTTLKELYLNEAYSYLYEDSFDTFRVDSWTKMYHMEQQKVVLLAS